MPDTLAIILLNWNGKADTLECLASLQEDSCPGAEIIVVDNGSNDGSIAAIRNAFPRVTLVETQKNLGFTGGNNAGIEYALALGVKYIYLLNNDTTVQPGSTAKLTAALEADASCGLACPVMHYFHTPAEPWFAGASIDLANGTALHDNSHLPSEGDAPIEVPWATGCAMMLRADLLRQLGGFDERFFLYWEDVDLSLRVKDLGHTIKLVPASRIYHKCGQTANRTISTFGEYYYLRNNLLLVDKHTEAQSRRSAKWRILKRAAGRCARSPQKWKHTQAVTKALFDYARGQFGKAH